MRVRTNHVKPARQERSTAVSRLALVSWMVFKEVSFRIKHLLDCFQRVDVTLATVHHRNMAQAWRNDAAARMSNISTGIPKILGVSVIRGVAERNQYSH